MMGLPSKKELEETLLGNITANYMLACEERGVECKILNSQPEKNDGWIWIQFGNEFIFMKADTDTVAEITDHVCNSILDEITTDQGIIGKAIGMQLKSAQKKIHRILDDIKSLKED